MFKSYFSAKHVLDKGALFNYVLSDRSDGKTFDCKVRALYDFKNKGTISIYMRRFKTELTASVYESFFNDVLGDLKPEKEKYRQDFKDWEFRGFKRGVQANIDNTGYVCNEIVDDLFNKPITDTVATAYNVMRFDFANVFGNFTQKIAKALRDILYNGFKIWYDETKINV